MDTSIHEWFEERGEKAVLISMIDDATSRLWTRFYPADSTSTDMAMLCSYFRRFGRPVALYAGPLGNPADRRRLRSGSIELRSGRRLRAGRAGRDGEALGALLGAVLLSGSQFLRDFVKSVPL